MAQSLIQIYAHIIFSTKRKEDLMAEQDLRNIYSYIKAVINNNNCEPIMIGGATDHIHVLCKLASAASIATLLQAIKRPSSKWIKSIAPIYENFGWQHGYITFSIGQSEVEEVKAYIANQHIYHETRSFREELIEILTKLNVADVESYL